MLFVAGSGPLLGVGGTVLLLVLQVESLRRDPPLPPLPAAVWLDLPASCWLSRWLLVFQGRDARGRRCQVALFADQLRAADHARLRRLLLRLQSGSPWTDQDHFDLL